MTVRFHSTGTPRPTLDSYRAIPIQSRRLRHRAYSRFWLASVVTSLLTGFVLGVMI